MIEIVTISAIDLLAMHGRNNFIITHGKGSPTLLEIPTVPFIFMYSGIFGCAKILRLIYFCNNLTCSVAVNVVKFF